MPVFSFHLPKAVTTSRRDGITMVELLGVMVVLALLASIGVGGASHMQSMARESNTNAALRAYYNAFSNAVITHPGIVSDRIKSWTGESTYSSEKGLERVVSIMNTYVEEDLALVWDDTLKAYVSRGADEWGGNYILTEYPEQPSGVTYFDPSIDRVPRMCLSVWNTGINEDIITSKVVPENCYGAGMIFQNGLTSVIYHGVEDATPFNGWTLRFQ